jgi:hypothetical protein
MPWSQDVVLYVLFLLLLPCLSIHKKECWFKSDMRCIFEGLLMFYCGVELSQIHELIETFVIKELSISSVSIHKKNLNRDLKFLSEIGNNTELRIFKRLTFKARRSKYLRANSLYTFLI